MKARNEAVIVSIDIRKDGSAVLCVGKETNGLMEVINAFEGAEAIALYNKLTVKKGMKTNDN